MLPPARANERKRATHICHHPPPPPRRLVLSARAPPRPPPSPQGRFGVQLSQISVPRGTATFNPTFADATSPTTPPSTGGGGLGFFGGLSARRLRRRLLSVCGFSKTAAVQESYEKSGAAVSDSSPAESRRRGLHQPEGSSNRQSTKKDSGGNSGKDDRDDREKDLPPSTHRGSREVQEPPGCVHPAPSRVC